jgi:methyl-accepting chemotaxis protein
MKRTIRTKLLLICLAMGMLPASIVALFAWRAGNDMGEGVAKNYESIASEIGDKIDRNLFERYGDVQAFGYNAVVQNRDQWYQQSDDNAITATMNKYVRAYGCYRLMLLVDTDGRLIATNTVDAKGTKLDTAFLYDGNYKEQAWFRDALEGRYYQSKDGTFTGTVVEHLYEDPYVKRAYADEGLSLGFSAPVRDEEGKVIAVWKNVADFAVVEQIVSDCYQTLKARDLASAEITILDDQGRVIVDYDPTLRSSDAIHRDMSVLGKFNLAQSGVDAAQRVLQGETGALIECLHARKKIPQSVGFSPLKGALGFPGMKWNVLVRVSCAESLAGVRSLQWSVATALAGSLVAILVISSLVASRIGKPLNALAQVADQVALGDVEVAVNYRSQDEIGRLADSFRTMIDAQRGLASAAGRIAAGDMSVEVTTRSDKDALSKSFQVLKNTVQGVATEINSVAQASKAGQLSKRGNAGHFDGAYRELLQGLNDTLDAVIEPVNESADVLEKVAARDLTHRVNGNYLGDHAKIKNALNMALDNLEEVLAQTAAGSEQVTSAATQIANGSQALAQGASEQASSLEEVSSSLEEMASMTRQNADNSNQGKLLAGESQQSSLRGNEAMHRMADAIGKIKASSDATAKIVKTIDEIAFQTNLLALNAAVEAARAGEAGKGFAVVAEEVRNLAQRSAEAAKNTADMIEESVKNADGGVKITDEVASILNEIGEGSRKVNDLVAEIAAACGEQSKGIEQINLAVTQLDKVTQQNAANSEESASAAEELNGQAASLSQTVAQFKIKAQVSPGTSLTSTTTSASKPVAGDRTRRGWEGASAKKPSNGHAKELVGAGSSANGNGQAKKPSRILPLDDEDFKGF